MPVLECGQRLGAYRIEGILGHGGMAEVYRATHLALERPVAIKVLSPALNADPTFLLRFAREAKTVARLDHPHIVTVHDYGEEGTLAYLVLQLAEGGTLRDPAGRSWPTSAWRASCARVWTTPRSKAGRARQTTWRRSRRWAGRWTGAWTSTRWASSPTS